MSENLIAIHDYAQGHDVKCISSLGAAPVHITYFYLQYSGHKRCQAAEHQAA
jgi:hypothetical protein